MLFPFPRRQIKNGGDSRWWPKNENQEANERNSSLKPQPEISALRDEYWVEWYSMNGTVIEEILMNICVGQNVEPFPSSLSSWAATEQIASNLFKTAKPHYALSPSQVYLIKSDDKRCLIISARERRRFAIVSRTVLPATSKRQQHPLLGITQRLFRERFRSVFRYAPLSNGARLHSKHKTPPCVHIERELEHLIS